MQRLRRIIFWTHLCCGVFAGAVVLLMSVTGVLLTYEMQLQKWEAGGTVEAPADAQPLPLAAILWKAKCERPDPPSTLTLSSDSFQAVTVGWGRQGSALIDPYTGDVLPESPRAVREGLSTLRSWHRWLGQEGDNRAFGRSVTGACNLAFLFIVTSGLYLWWPRKWTASNLKAIVLFRSGLSGKTRDFNWHNVIGFWSMIPLFFIALSGAVISYPWVSGLVYRAFGEEPPLRSSASPPVEASATPLPIIEGLPLEAYLDQAASLSPDWKTVRVHLPRPTDETITLMIDRGSGRQPHLQSTLTLDRKTAKQVRLQTFADQTPGSRARRILRFAHTGEAAGVVGQTIAGIVSLGACVLVWTGIALSWRRFRAWTARRTNA